MICHFTCIHKYFVYTAKAKNATTYEAFSTIAWGDAGFGIVGTTVASSTTDPQFKSSQRPF